MLPKKYWHTKCIINLLQSVLRSSDSDKRSACETLDYFLRRLGSQQTRQRLLALKGLRLVLTPLKSDEEEDMETDASGEDPSESWLLTHLPKVPCFTDVYDHVSRHLRHACQVENDPATVALYVRFLVRYAPEPLADLADLCLDMSTIIVERSTIHPAIICHTATHRALLELFDGYVRHLIELGPASAQAFSSSEQRQEAVTVVFNSFGQPPKEATLHFFVIHAQIILLTFMPKVMSPDSEEDVKVATKLHDNLLRVWFHQGQAPQAFLLSTKEEAALIPDWLKLKMIRSDSPVLVDTALRELNVQQLVLFIQSFGIPVASMSKLLGELDTVAIRDPVS